ncbi:hypothetical protein CXG81DRAFT_14735 [Caulochytrium protostelioides]|uniref:acetylornithine transaminase n=1 Tax=Caulochytrium protostelioides TaxID=1555241 RepID=A0A4P9X074_9FUNG|nr:hypothetical protein CXG81DRAFT_14735 [Caulochytrium protostelioides]|eukprot:RKO99269.1 hypothetical protein CXG81DRAFT_14735 [Caulochytrium protostelioides]
MASAQHIAEDKQSLLQVYAQPDDVVISHGKGCYLYDTDGRKFLDLNAGIAVNALGHGDPEFVAVIQQQAAKIVHLSNLYHNEHAGPLAKKMLDAVGPVGPFAQGGKVFFSNSGTEANEAAIKFARKYARVAHPDKPNKTRIISFERAFHGRTLGSLSATPAAKYQAPFMPLVPGFVHTPYNDIEAFLAAIDETVCAVMIEPVQGEGGIHPATPGFLTAVREACDRVGALMVADEIQAGLGRTGTVFAYQGLAHAVVPDVITIAKPLANGIPIGAVIMAQPVADSMKPGEHGTTFGGSPFATAVATHVWDRITAPAFLRHVEETGNALSQAMRGLAEAHPRLFKAVRSRGLMLGLELQDDVAPAAFVDRARAHGALTISAGTNVIRLVPALIFSEKEIAETERIFKLVIQDLETQL